MIALLLLLAAAPRVAVVVHPAGFADDDARRLQDKVSQEVQATGAELASASLEVKTECLLDRVCARDALRTADAGYLVWIEALRVGGQVQLDCRLLDAEGRSIAQSDSAARADDVIGTGVVVPASVLAPLKSAAAKPPATPANAPPALTSSATATPSATPPSPGPAPLAAETDTAAATAAPAALSPLAVGSIAAIGGGALLALGGGALAASQLNVIRDPGSLGTAKESAASLATAMFVVAGVGVAVAGAGGVLLYLGL